MRFSVSAQSTDDFCTVVLEYTSKILVLCHQQIVYMNICMILWLWGSLSGDFDHLGGLADVQDFVDKRKQKLSFLSILLLSLVCVPPNKPV